jgi:plastocyanin
LLVLVTAAAALGWSTPVALPGPRGTGLLIASMEEPRLLQRPAASRNGAVRGRVEPRAATVAAHRPNVADPTAGPKRPPERSTAVLYLETAPRGAFEQSEPGRARMDQRNETFVPHVLAITTGTIVDFPNSDLIYHNVFSLSKPARFDLGRYAAGRSKSVRFDKPGIVRVFCDIHSHMNAFILVFSHPFFAVADDEGRYRIDGIPPGTYTVIAWSDRTSLEAKAVTVPEGAVAQLDFTSSP